MAPKLMSKKTESDSAVILPSEILDEDRQYLNQLVENRKSIEVAINSFSTYMGGKYKLDQGDQITLEGKIIRAPKANE